MGGDCFFVMDHRNTDLIKENNMGTYENNEYEDTDVYDISVCVLGKR